MNVEIDELDDIRYDVKIAPHFDPDVKADVVWFALCEFPNITFMFDNMVFGEENDDGTVNINFDLFFENTDMEELSQKADGFDAIVEKLIIQMLTKANHAAEQLLKDEL